MPTRLVHLVVDAAEPAKLARFWAAALGWEIGAEEDGEVDLSPGGYDYPDPVALPLVFVPVTEAKTVKNRVHLDLATESAEHQEAEVRRLLALGAVPVDIGQGDVPWQVLADPEGNEFCVLVPRPVYLGIGPVAAVVADYADPAAVAAFWQLATGWVPASSVPDGIRSGRRRASGPTSSCCRRAMSRRSRTGCTWTWLRPAAKIRPRRSRCCSRRARCRSTSGRATPAGPCSPTRKATNSAS